MMSVVSTDKLSATFTADQVRSALDGKKTQHRIPIEIQPIALSAAQVPYRRPNGKYVWVLEETGIGLSPLSTFECPFGEVGDTFWVKEEWCALEFNDTEIGVIYPATNPTKPFARNDVHWIKVGEKEVDEYLSKSVEPIAATCMPEWASRLRMRTTNIRVERLLSMERNDVFAEGCPAEFVVMSDASRWDEGFESRFDWFRWYFESWDSIYSGKPEFCSHNNPWVFVGEFEAMVP